MKYCGAPLGIQVCRALGERGVETVFGIPGVHNQELYRGLIGSGIRHVLARHEQGAGFMADGYARAARKPGVMFLISGPGFTNAMTPIGQAYSDSVPLLAISSCLEASDPYAGRGRLHEMKDQPSAGRCVADWSLAAADADEVFRLIDRAFVEFEARRPRPKAIHIPVGLLKSHAAAPDSPRRHGCRSKPSERAIRECAALLEKSKRPLFLIGGGSVDASESIRSIVDRIGAAVFCTVAGRGAVPSSHPLNFGTYLQRPESAAVLASADLILAVGTALAEGDFWRSDPGHGAPLIRFDIDPLAMSNAKGTKTAVLGDCKAAMRMLDRILDQSWRESNWVPAEILEFRRKMRCRCDLRRPGIAQAVDALSEAIPENGVVYSDMTQFAYVGQETFEAESPGRWHHPTGFGTLGYALPAAIGGKIALPESPVVAVAGDFGFQFSMQELSVAVELSLPIPVIVWDNSGLGEIEDSMRRAQMGISGAKARNPDFLALGRAFGAFAREPRSLDEFKRVVAEALDADRPSIIRAAPDIV